MERAGYLWIFCILVGSLLDSCRSQKVENCKMFGMSLITENREVCVTNRDEYLRNEHWCISADFLETDDEICQLSWHKHDYFKIAELMQDIGTKQTSLPYCIDMSISRKIQCRLCDLCDVNVLSKFKRSSQHFCSDSSPKWTPTFLFHEKDTESYCRIRNPKSVTQPTYDLAPNCDLSKDAIVNHLEIMDEKDCRKKENECMNNGRCNPWPEVFFRCQCKWPFSGPRCEKIETASKCNSKTCRAGKCKKIKEVGKTIVKRNDLMTYKDDKYFCMCKTGLRGKGCHELCSIGSYGKLCNSNCSQYCQDGACDAKNGKCFCEAGSRAYGPKCNQLSCTTDEDCNGAECKISKGKENVCDCSTILGFTGPDCSQECTGNKFGAGCKKKCGHCRELPCNHRDGTCKKPDSGEAACRGAYEPPLCKSRPIGAIISSVLATFRMIGNRIGISRRPRYQRLVSDDIENTIEGIFNEGYEPEGDITVDEIAVSNLRKRRQAPESSQTVVEVSFTAEFLAEDVNDANLDQEVMSLLKENAEKLESDLLPGMSVDKTSISVSQVRTVIVGGHSSSSDSNSSWKYVALGMSGFFVLVLGALFAVILCTRRQKSGQLNHRKRLSWIPPRNTRMYMNSAEPSGRA